MEIRSVTGFMDVALPLSRDSLDQLATSIDQIKGVLTENDHHVQSTRLAVQPFSEIVDVSDPVACVEFAKELEALAFIHKLDYVALGPVTLDAPDEALDRIVDILAQTENVFLSMEIATGSGEIDINRITRAAEVIKEVAIISPDGFKNLFLTTLAGVKPWSPFLPSAYHGGGESCIALAIENADMTIDAIRASGTLLEARQNIIGAVEGAAQKLQPVVIECLNQVEGISFKGFDFSYAPYPDDARSIGAALEALGLTAFGSTGSLFASAFLTEALDNAHFMRTGFNGLMLAILEDSVLARRVGEGRLTIPELLSYSAVCGTGLDLITLPGEVPLDVIKGMLLDVAALSCRLTKQLTARIMPIPGAFAGDRVEFDFEYFAPCVVMTPQETDLRGPIEEKGRIRLHPRKR